MQFTVMRGDFAFVFKHDGGIIGPATRAFFEHRRDDPDLLGFGDLSDDLGSGAVQRFGVIERTVVAVLGKIRRAEQFLEANNLGSSLGRFLDETDGGVQVFVGVLRGFGLDDGDGNGRCGFRSLRNQGNSNLNAKILNKTAEKHARRTFHGNRL